LIVKLGNRSKQDILFKKASINAQTQHIDHPLDYKLGDNKLLKRIWFGDGEAIKKKAYTLAVGYLMSA